MFCTKCDHEDENLTLERPICVKCGYDNSYVLGLIAADEDDAELFVEDEIRSVVACAQRCIVLFSIVVASYDEDREVICDWLKREELWQFVSPEEKQFLESKNPTERQFINAGWRAEALYLLLWVVGKVDNLSDFKEECDADQIKNGCGFYLQSTKGFIETAKLRTEEEVFDMQDSIYDTHWSIRDASLRNKASFSHTAASIIRERHHAINWAVGYCGQEWDEITTDT